MRLFLVVWLSMLVVGCASTNDYTQPVHNPYAPWVVIATSTTGNKTLAEPSTVEQLDKNVRRVTTKDTESPGVWTIWLVDCFSKETTLGQILPATGEKFVLKYKSKFTTPKVGSVGEEVMSWTCSRRI